MALQHDFRQAAILLDAPKEVVLGALPAKGSIRITYEPALDLWSLFMKTGDDYVDPAGPLPLIGTAVDATYTHSPLPYFSFTGSSTGADYFDNLSISIVPEPRIEWLGSLALFAALLYWRC